MEQEIVHTPDGPMRIAGSLRLFFAILVDVLAATLVLMTVFSLFYRLELKVPRSLGWIPGLFVFIYALFAHRHKVPSLGNWSLALRSYPSSLVEGRSGNGTLVVTEELTSPSRTYRFTVVFLLLAGLFSLFIAV